MNDHIETKDQNSGMSEGHVLDLKLPIGWLLSAYGVLLTVYGLLTRRDMYAISLGINLNLVWGLLMIAIGGGFLLAAFLKKRKGAASRTNGPANPPAGR
jgi:hypothetical protein